MRRISRTSSRRDLELLGDLVGVRLAAETLHELALDVHDLVQLLDHVHGDADRARLVGDRARDGLADPPRRVRRELVALAVVELLDGADQAERAFLDQVEEAEAAAEVALGDRDDEAEVRLGHLRLRRHVAALDALREADFLVGGEERHLADLAQVEAEAVEARLDGEVELRRRRELVFLRLRLLVRRRLVLLPFDQLDVVVDQVRVEVFDLLFRELDFLEPGDDLVVGEEAFLRVRPRRASGALRLRGAASLDGEQLWHSDLRLVLDDDDDDEPDMQRPVDPRPASPSKQARSIVRRYRFVKKCVRSHEVATAISPTGSPRLSSTGTVARPGRATPSGARKAASAGPSGRLEPSSHFSAMPSPSGAGRAEEALGAALREPAGRGAHQLEVDAVGAADELGVRAHRVGDAACARQLLEARERVGHALEREREGDDAAAVGRGRELGRVGVGGLGVRGAAGLLHRMAGQAVALERPAVGAAEGEHAGVLAGAVVEDLLRRAPCLQAELEVVLGGGRLREQRAHGGDLVVGRAVRRATQSRGRARRGRRARARAAAPGSASTTSA